MTTLEDRIRTGLHETAQRIPEVGNQLGTGRARRGRLPGIWMGVVAVAAVLALFSPLLLLGGSGSRSVAGDDSGPLQPTVNSGLVPTDVGFEFANPEHVQLEFTQDLTLTCGSAEAIDNGGFESFTMDIWMDRQAGYARLGIDYPDGSTYDLIFQGRSGAWENAWGRGTDLGRNAGCRESFDDGSYSQSIAGWAFQDKSDLWFAAYLTPVTRDDEGVVIHHEGVPTLANPTGSDSFVIESLSPGGTEVLHEFTLDDAGIRVESEQRYIKVPDQFEANATTGVLATGPAEMPSEIFDTSTFTPLWGSDPVVTTEGTTP